jgi:hypothetical protein
MINRGGRDLDLEPVTVEPLDSAFFGPGLDPHTEFPCMGTDLLYILGILSGHYCKKGNFRNYGGILETLEI